MNKMREMFRDRGRLLTDPELLVAGHIYMCRCMRWKVSVSSMVMLMREELRALSENWEDSRID